MSAPRSPWWDLNAPDSLLFLTRVGPIRPDDLDAVLATRRSRNASTLRHVSLTTTVLVSIQFIVILIDGALAGKPLVQAAYLASFGIGVAVSLVLYTLWRFGAVQRGQTFYIWFVLAEGVAITLCDLQLTGDFSSYVLILFGTALLYSAPLGWYVLAFGLSWAALFTGMVLTVPNALALTPLAATGVLTAVGILAGVLLELRRIRTEVLALELERKNLEWKEASLRDPLTGLHNRRFLFEWLDVQLAQSRRNGQPLSVALVDLDHFKTVNDTAGHDVGDQVLKEAARWLSEALRTADVVARFGGEEFVLVFPSASEETARAVVARCLDQFRQSRVEGWSEAVTFSAGLATLGPTETIKELFHRVDRLLYQAKETGRNRIVSG